MYDDVDASIGFLQRRQVVRLDTHRAHESQTQLRPTCLFQTVAASGSRASANLVGDFLRQHVDEDFRLVSADGDSLCTKAVGRHFEHAMFTATNLNRQWRPPNLLTATNDLGILRLGPQHDAHPIG